MRTLKIVGFSGIYKVPKVSILLRIIVCRYIENIFRVVSTNESSLNAYCLEGIGKSVSMCKNKHTCFQFLRPMTEKRIDLTILPLRTPYLRILKPESRH